MAQLLESVAAFPPLVLALAVAGASGTLGALALLAIALARLPTSRARSARRSSSRRRARSSRGARWVLRPPASSPVTSRRTAGPVLAAAPGVGSVVLLEASFDFLRVGVPAGTASWGRLFSEVRARAGGLVAPPVPHRDLVTVASQQAVASRRARRARPAETRLRSRELRARAI